MRAVRERDLDTARVAYFRSSSSSSSQMLGLCEKRFKWSQGHFPVKSSSTRHCAIQKSGKSPLQTPRLLSKFGTVVLVLRRRGLCRVAPRGGASCRPSRRTGQCRRPPVATRGCAALRASAVSAPPDDDDENYERQNLLSKKTSALSFKTQRETRSFVAAWRSRTVASQVEETCATNSQVSTWPLKWENIELKV